MSAASRRLRWWFAYWISRAGARVGRYLPARVWYTLAEPVADACYLFMRQRRNTLKQNLRRVIAEEQVPSAARQVFRNFARYVIDFYQLPSLSSEELCNRMEFHDWRHLNEALSGERGAVFVTLHLGQAELGGGALAAYGHPINAIAEHLDYAPMDRFIQGLRRGLGMKVISPRQAKLGVMRCLSRGEALAMMVDVVEPGEGVLVDFFGAPTEFSTAPGRIAIRTGSRVMAGVVARDPGDRTRLMPLIDFGITYQSSGDEDADVLVLTQTIARSLEQYVRRFPEQWFAFRPVWSKPSIQFDEPGKSTGAWKQWALSAGIRVGSLLPRRAAYAVATWAGDLAYRFRPGARADVIDNMRHVLGEAAPHQAVETAAREVFRNVARYYVDLIRLPRMNLRLELGRTCRLHGFDRLKGRLDAGEGVVVATAHFGNPELAVQVGAILGLDVLVLAEPLEPPAFAEIMRRLRSAFGPRYEDVGFSAVADSLRHLRSGGCVAIACDRDIQGKGTPLPFFGVETRLPLGAVELAQRTGAHLLPAFCRRAEDSGFDIHFEEPLKLVNTGRPREDALTNARRLLSRAEHWIGADPGQWMVLERIWKPLLPYAPGAKPPPRQEADRRPLTLQ